MNPDLQELMNAVSKSVSELHQKMDLNHHIIASVLGEKVDERQLQQLRQYSFSCTREARLKEAIHEAIEILDESRKSFKSKKLEALRKKLTRILIEAE